MRENTLRKPGCFALLTCSLLSTVCLLSIRVADANLVTLNGQSAGHVLPLSTVNTYTVTATTDSLTALLLAPAGSCESTFPSLGVLASGTGILSVSTRLITGTAVGGTLYEVCEAASSGGVGSGSGFYAYLLPELSDTVVFVPQLAGGTSRSIAFSVAHADAETVAAGVTLSVALQSSCGSVAAAQVASSSSRIVTLAGSGGATSTVSLTAQAIEDYLTAHPASTSAAVRYNARLCVAVQGATTAAGATLSNTVDVAAASTFADWGVEVVYLAGIAVNGYAADAAATSTIGILAPTTTGGALQVRVTWVSAVPTTTTSTVPVSFILSSTNCASAASTFTVASDTSAAAGITPAATASNVLETTGSTALHTSGSAFDICISTDGGSQFRSTSVRVSFFSLSLSAGVDLSSDNALLGALALSSPEMGVTTSFDTTALVRSNLRVAIARAARCTQVSGISYSVAALPATGSAIDAGAASSLTSFFGFYALCAGSAAGSVVDPSTNEAAVAPLAPLLVSSTGAQRRMIVETIQAIAGLAPGQPSSTGGVLYHESTVNEPIVLQFATFATSAGSWAMTVVASAAECTSTTPGTFFAPTVIQGSLYSYTCAACGSARPDSVASTGDTLCVAATGRTSVASDVTNTSAAVPLFAPAIVVFVLTIDGFDLGAEGAAAVPFPLLEGFDTTLSLAVTGAQSPSAALAATTIYIGDGLGAASSCFSTAGTAASTVFTTNVAAGTATLTATALAAVGGVGSDSSTSAAICLTSHAATGTAYGGQTRLELRRVRITSINAATVSAASPPTLTVVEGAAMELTLIGTFAADVAVTLSTDSARSADVQAVFVSSTVMRANFTVNDTSARFLTATLGQRTASSARYTLASLVALSVSQIGQDTTGKSTEVLADDTVTLPLLLSVSSVVVSGSCIGLPSVAGSTQCTCAATTTYSTAGTITVSAPSASVTPQTYELCFAFDGALTHSTSGATIVVLPPLQSFAGATPGGTSYRAAVLQGTSPTVQVAFGSTVNAEDVSSTATGGGTLYALFLAVDAAGAADVPTTGSLTSAFDCDGLSASTAGEPATGSWAALDLAAAFPNGTATSATIDLPAASTQVASAVCVAFVWSTVATVAAPSLSAFVHSTGVTIDIATTNVNGVSASGLTTTVLPIFAQTTTYLFVSAGGTAGVSAANVQLAVVDRSIGGASPCSEVPTGPTSAVYNMPSYSAALAVTEVTPLLLSRFQGSGVASSATHVAELPRGTITSGAQFDLCLRYGSSGLYSPTSLGLSASTIDTIDDQTSTQVTFSTNVPDPGTTTALSSGGVGAASGPTRRATVSGSRVAVGCLVGAFLSGAGTSCDLTLPAFATAGAFMVASPGTTTQVLSFSSTVSTSYSALCLATLPTCPATSEAVSAVASSISVLRVAMPIRFFDFQYYVVAPATTSTHQTEVLAFRGLDTQIALTQRAQTVAAPFAATLIQPESSLSCNGTIEGATVETVSTAANSGTSTHSFTSPRDASLPRYRVCFLATGYDLQSGLGVYSMGLTLITVDLIVASQPLGNATSISVTSNRAPELVVTGANLNVGVVYMAITDSANCAGPFIGTSGVGVSRAPSLLTGCGGTTGTVSFTAASATTDGSPLRVCIAGVPASYGVNSSADLSFFDTGISYIVTEAQRLVIVTQPGPRAVLARNGELETQPVLRLSALDGSLLTTIPDITIVATWILVGPPEFLLTANTTSLPQSIVASITGNPVSIDFSIESRKIFLPNALHSVEYALNFTDDAGTLPGALSDPVTAGPCAATEYGRPFSDVCEVCPDNAVCTGEPEFMVSSSFWRLTNRSPYLYDCGLPYGTSQCEGGTATGTCTDGHTGPRCTSCLPGYGKSIDTCVPCQDDKLSIGTVVGIVVVMLAIFYFLCFSTLQADAAALRPVYMKIAITHLVTASSVGDFAEQLPLLLQELFDRYRVASRPSPVFASAECLGVDVYSAFIITNLAPLAVLPLAIGVGALFVVFGKRSAASEFDRRADWDRNMRKALNAKEREEIEAEVARQERHDRAVREATEEMERRERRRKEDELRMFGAQQKAVDDADVGLDVLDKEDAASEGDIGCVDSGDPYNGAGLGPGVIGGSVADTGGDMASALRNLEDDAEFQALVKELIADDEAKAAHRGAKTGLPKKDPQVATEDGENSTSPNTDEPHPGEVVTRGCCGAAHFLIMGDHSHRGQPPSYFLDAQVQADEAEQRETEDERRRHGGFSFLGVFLASLIVALFLAYPSLVQENMKLNQCEPMNVGESDVSGVIADRTITVYAFDRRIECDSAEHIDYRIAASALAGFYGVLIPVGITVSMAVALFRKGSSSSHDEDEDEAGAAAVVSVEHSDNAKAKKLLQFLLIGYRDAIWFWEPVLLVRKALLIVITVFLADNKSLQTLVAMWLLAVFLGLQLLAKPYVKARLNWLEVTSLVVVLVTLNASLLYRYIPMTSTAGLALTGFLCTINVAIVCVLFLLFMYEFKMEIQQSVYDARFRWLLLEHEFPNFVAVCKWMTRNIEEREGRLAVEQTQRLRYNAILSGNQRLGNKYALNLAVAGLDSADDRAALARAQARRRHEKEAAKAAHSPVHDDDDDNGDANGPGHLGPVSSDSMAYRMETSILSSLPNNNSMAGAGALPPGLVASPSFSLNESPSMRRVGLKKKSVVISPPAALKYHNPDADDDDDDGPVDPMTELSRIRVRYRELQDKYTFTLATQRESVAAYREVHEGRVATEAELEALRGQVQQAESAVNEAMERATREATANAALAAEADALRQREAAAKEEAEALKRQLAEANASHERQAQSLRRRQVAAESEVAAARSKPTPEVDDAAKARIISEWQAAAAKTDTELAAAAHDQRRRHSVAVDQKRLRRSRSHYSRSATPEPMSVAVPPATAGSIGNGIAVTGPSPAASNAGGSRAHTAGSAVQSNNSGATPPAALPPWQLNKVPPKFTIEQARRLREMRKQNPDLGSKPAVPTAMLAFMDHPPQQPDEVDDEDTTASRTPPPPGVAQSDGGAGSTPPASEGGGKRSAAAAASPAPSSRSSAEALSP